MRRPLLWLFVGLAVALAGFGLLADRALVREAAATAALASARTGEDARTAALSVSGALSRIEQELLAGHGLPDIRSDAVMIPPAPAVARGRSYGGRPRLELTALLASALSTPSGLPEAVVAAIALGDPAAHLDLAERLLGGALPVRPDDLPALAEILKVGGDPRVASLQARLRALPANADLPEAPLFRRMFRTSLVEGWTRRGREAFHYVAPLGRVFESAGVAARAIVAPAGAAVPDVVGLALRVRPEPGPNVFGARAPLWAAVGLCLAALVLVQRALSAQSRAVAREKAFLAGVTHELRTPVTAIRIFGETLAEGRGDPREYGVLLAQESERLEALVERVLAATRIDEAPAFAGVRPAELLASAVRLMHARAERRGITLHQAPHDELGEALWDGEAVRRALLNLIDNAVKHGRAGGRVDVGAEAAEGHVRLFVRDDGPGIARRDRAALFGRFARGQTDAPGTGLGLYLVDQTARAHGGRVELVSREGEGCRFSLELPRRPPAVRESRA